MATDHKKSAARRGRTLGWVIGVIAIVVIALVLLLPAIRNVEPRTGRPPCLNNVKQLGLAIYNYHSAAKAYPPLYSTDENGKPLHSWRVLILPYLEGDNLYRQIDLTKPWDHPDNVKFHDQIPSIYRCPSNRTAADNTTGYLAISGDQTVWDSTGRKRKDDEITDDKTHTILIIESQEHQVNWMQPIDMDFETAMSLFEQGRLLKGHHGGSNVVFADGSARFIERSENPNLRAMLTINGGELVED